MGGTRRSLFINNSPGLIFAPARSRDNRHDHYSEHAQADEKRDCGIHA